VAIVADGAGEALGIIIVSVGEVTVGGIIVVCCVGIGVGSESVGVYVAIVGDTAVA
jgi:hypothetical protein